MGVVKLSTAGILDYQKYSSALAGNSPYIPFISDYDLLETEILTGTQASVTFSSLNSTYGSTYQHLQLRMVNRTDRSANNSDTVQLNFNGDTGSNYAFHRLYGDGSSLASLASASQTYINAGVTSGATSTANSFSALIVDILNPFETTKHTTTRALSGQTSASFIFYNGGLWNNTAAVDSIVLDGLNGSFVTGSRFSLYGLKVA